MNRREFEESVAREKGETVEAMGRRGCYSGLSGGEWEYRAVPVEFSAEQRARALDGMVSPALFGDVPPVNGGAA